MIAVIYHPDTGAIAQTVIAPQESVVDTAAHLGLDWLEVTGQFAPQDLDGLDATHMVAGGALVAKVAS